MYGGNLIPYFTCEAVTSMELGKYRKEFKRMLRSTATYPLTYERRKDLKRRFTHHPPKGAQPERYLRIRARTLSLARLIAVEAPEGREKDLAFTRLEEASFWANAAIARGE